MDKYFVYEYYLGGGYDLKGFFDEREKAISFAKERAQVMGVVKTDVRKQSYPLGKKRGPSGAKNLHFAGYDFTASARRTTVHRGKVDTGVTGDYGADPMGDGTFRMVPSGDIVSFEERNRRLKQ